MKLLGLSGSERAPGFPDDPLVLHSDPAALYHGAGRGERGAAVAHHLQGHALVDLDLAGRLLQVIYLGNEPR